jgi:putative transcriptional regulator
MENRIREFREELGLTQQGLATMTGVSRQTIISLENGRYNPSILLAFRIARLFGRHIEEVFVYREENEHE